MEKCTFKPVTNKTVASSLKNVQSLPSFRLKEQSVTLAAFKEQKLEQMREEQEAAKVR